LELSIVIVHYRVKEFLWLCLSSLQEACSSISYEIIIVDNDPQDQCKAYVGNEFTHIHWILNTENLGFAKANNQGVAMARGKYVLILNPDTVVSETNLQNVLNYAREKENFGAIGARMIDGTGKFLPESKRNIPTPLVAFHKIFGKDKSYYAHHLQESQIAEVEVLPGAFMLLKKSIYEEAGGFDEDYFMFGEDIDLCYRLRQRGYKNYYFGKSVVIHFKGESTRKDASYYKNFYGAMQIYFGKHYPQKQVLSHLNRILIKTLIAFQTAAKVEISESIKKESILFFGWKTKRSEALRLTLAAKQWQYISKKEEINGSYDMLILDQGFLNFDEIVFFYQQDNFKFLLKRILSKDKNICLGSDDSKKTGEVLIW